MKRAGAAWQTFSSLGLMAASGFAALGYQIIWTQQTSLWLGHEAAAVLAVVSAFFGGLALGGLALGPSVERSAHPRRWYVGCEIVIASWGLFVVSTSSPWSSLVLGLIGSEPTPGRQWLVAFAGSFFLFLPATAAMGITLPAMERLTAELARQGRSIAPLYAANTFGAVLGVLSVACWLVSTVGLAKSALLCALLNLACAGIALVVFPKTLESPAKRSLVRGRARVAVLRLAFTGLFGIGIEVLVVRVLSQITENTVYTFAFLLAVYLVGSGAGAAAYRRWLERRKLRDRLGDELLIALAGACLFTTLALYAAEGLKAWTIDAFGASEASALAAEAVLALAAFGPPTIVMGALFSELCRVAHAAGLSFGRALGVNTLAAAGAPVLCGVIALPALGAKSALLGIALGYLALTSRGAWSKTRVWVPAAVALAALVFAPPLVFVTVPAGGRMVSYQEGVTAAVSVISDADGILRLHINNRQQEGTNATRYLDARQAWLALLLHPAPSHALFLGLGTGVTASAAAEDPSLRVDAVELIPEVIAASKHFTERGQGSGSLRVIAADARRYVRASDRKYDVIVSDNFHPARSGSGSLYTIEHFAAVRERLGADGVFCQWLPLHQLDLETMRSIVRSFVTVYPKGWALIATNSLETPVVGLVARKSDERFDAMAIRGRIARMAAAEPLRGLGLDDEWALFGSFVAGPAALARLAAGAVANTDDLPVVSYRAPRVTYAPESSPGDRFLELLEKLSIEPAELTEPTADVSFARRLDAYWAARNHFIASGRNVKPTSNVHSMLAQVREPLLSVLRISPDFRPAYDPLISMARVLVRSDVSAARALLVELANLQPARTEASQLLLTIHPNTTFGTAPPHLSSTEKLH